MTRPKKSLGQNFLVDAWVASRIVESVNPESVDAIIEIGPGKGALTRQLAKKAGCVVGIEIDQHLADHLRIAIPAPNLSLIVGDVIVTDWGELISSVVAFWQRIAASRAEPRVRVVANLPYYVSTAVVQDLMEYCSHLFDITLMLQLEVVDRITGKPGSRDYGYLTVLVEYYCEAVKLFEVAPGSFLPVPRVWSAVMRLKPRAAPPVSVTDVPRFFSLVRAAFKHRRKTILNNLKDWAEGPRVVTTIRAALATCEIDPRRRAETLGIEEFSALYDAIEQARLLDR
ncbi:MAG TPA: 16S rRNA (adenine(1518)-N(6)/adenine(1519)-N(6))-dimethyltransferase RsmA [Blastocatellia bacterium]|nr:16S rRNA (adenine(1518)-N(6)/adenine(1519)-N(6))-dimethyltransferase RsmA [Blastocatellia bacterium]